ncbi:hypothetical protein [Micromonospora sp. LOL_024]|uniref:hypothetical protein n=1 Tax=Micromonospora sp. LOL_024 TaxID=3345412 RepID=UPI003A883C97
MSCARPVRLSVALVAIIVTVVAMAVFGRPGPVDATSGDIAIVAYDLGNDHVFTDPPDWPYESEIKAVVHHPARLRGTAPMIMLLHGQQLSCYSADEQDWQWPCPPGVQPYPSHRGYDYLGRALARDGFVVVSISANGLNHQMGVAPQRARLINRHLELWQQLNDTGGGPLAGRFTAPGTGRPVRTDFRGMVDLTRVGTMGHSVAGEGVMYQAADANRAELPAGVRIRGAVTVASPGASGFFDVQVTRLPIAVMSSECWGQRDREYFDLASEDPEAVAFLVRLAKGNHNYFNTVWTSGPGPGDGDDTRCPTAPERPSAEQQQQLAVTYLRAFYAFSLRGDARGMPVLDGTRPVPGVGTVIETAP